MDFPTAYALTLAIESAALYLILRGRYGAALIARNSLAANTATLPLVWLAFPLLSPFLGWGLYTAGAEIFAFLAEAGAYRLLFPDIGWRGAALASLACNALSFTAGLALEHVI